MKKSIRIAAALLAFCILLCAASCGEKKQTGLSGTYKMKELIPNDSFSFDGDSVTIFSRNIFGICTKGTYEIKDGRIYIVYNDFGVTKKADYSFTQKDDNTIVVDGYTMTKN